MSAEWVLTPESVQMLHGFASDLRLNDEDQGFLRQRLEGCERAAVARALTGGAALIAAERRRQVESEGYDADHDEGQSDALAMAAATYAMPTHLRRLSTYEPVPVTWPWHPTAWKPTGDRLRDLTKAGALIAAAIDALAALTEDVP